MSNEQQARELWSQLRQHFANAEETIAEIISQRAWEPLGYSTFADAWKSELTELTIPVEARPHVVYQMFADGLTAQDVALAVKGIGPRSAEALDRQRRNGVPPNHAVVREHYRRPASPPSHIRIDVGATMLAEYHRIALAVGLSVEDIALDAIRERFRELVVVKPKRKRSA